MARPGKLLIRIAAFTVASLAYGSAMASSFSGEIPVGYSNNQFQIGQGTSFLTININAIGTRDPAACSSCNSSYTDSFTVKLFDQSGTLLKSVNAVNYLYYNMFSSSRGIGAGPVGVAVPTGATTLEIVSQLSVAGLLGADGNALGFGNLFIGSDGSIAAATPIPSSLPLLATGLAALGLIAWRRKRKALSPTITQAGASDMPQAI
jgi:hypothetical protein